ncbi:MAG TPA: S41 family peptidase [Planctomycetaceae bacterium]|nr:S41 family peptidase [Planctomycetaceae bacterium]
MNPTSPAGNAEPAFERILPLLAFTAFGLFSLISIASASDFDTARVMGRVTDSEGKPLAGVKVHLNNIRGPVVLGGPTEARTDKDGRYEIAVQFSRGASLRLVNIFADLDGYVRGAPAFEAALKQGQKAKQDFRLERGMILSGVIVPPPPDSRFPRPQSWPKRTVLRITGPALRSWPDNAQFCVTDSTGRFQIWLPPGRYTLSSGPSWLDSAETEWPNLEAGQHDLVLRMNSRWTYKSPLTWEPAEAEAAFDELWSAMDRHYSYFFLKKDVDWNRLKRECRPRFLGAKSAGELTSVVHDMLAPLRDIHVWIRTAEGVVPTYASSYSYNGNSRITRGQLKDSTDCGGFAIVGKTNPDGFGYFLMLRQGLASRVAVQKAAAAIRALADPPGFIVDLRQASGGSEPLAQEIAKLFCAKETVYARSKRRSGPGHNDFGPENVRKLPATDNAYKRPVVCLIGPGAVSSGENFVQMMRSLPNVTLVGLPTRGASGNPRAFPISGTQLVVYFSRWVDMLPSGEPFEGVGILPDVPVEAEATDFSSADPTLEKGLQILRAKTGSDASAR